VNQEITEENKFILELTYPWKYMTECIIPKVETGKVEIVCQLGNSFSEYIMIPQQIIRKEPEELLSITSFKSVEELHWNKYKLPTDDTTDKNATSEDTDKEIGIALEEAEKRAEIKISFRQLNQFKYSSGTITFNLYNLISDSINKGETDTSLVNLILMSGEREDDTREVTCTLSEEVKPNEGQSLQGTFECSLSGLTEEYYSLRLNSSESVSGMFYEKRILLYQMMKSSMTQY
jgi:hypothetical protein